MRFKVKQRIPRSEALKLAGNLYKYQYALTEDNHIIRSWGDMEILEKLHKEYLPDWPPEKIIERAKKFTEWHKLPFLNLTSVKIKTDGKGYISFVDPKTKTPISTSQMGTDVAINDHWAKFSQSFGLFQKAVQKVDIDAFYVSITDAIASVESFLNLKAFLRNEQNKQNNLPPVITKDEIRNLPINKKVLEWPEKLSERRGRITKESREFICWKKLKNERDESAIHHKGPRKTPDIEKFLKLLNLYKYGEARLLMKLHKGDFRDRLHYLATFYLAVYKY